MVQPRTTQDTNNMIHIRNDIISGQSKGCFLCIQFRYTQILFRRWWSKSEKQGLHIYLFAPVHDPETGYRCQRLGIG